MKKILLILFFIAATIYAQGGGPPPNSILKNFKPFDTPRTNCRAGTIYRIDSNDVRYIVEDVSSIKSMLSREGNIIGQMTFTREELLTSLNLNFSIEYITTEVEIKNVEREYTEQANVDLILWENDKADEILIDPFSGYFIIRETILSKDVIYRFDKKSIKSLVTGGQKLKEVKASGESEIDFPFSIQKRYKEPKRIFYLAEVIPHDK